ncbi:hypothetical protein BCR42DRAFT_96944 [Absidia repens]|uniref:Uncharacterized protein n=1 Tax=Absidia repens TaxID=90262 RepID=A0A1X2I8R0_9FUNG|nr:hypothetical protein BCR42DRAFT_96944 [Absidia repens]
MDSLHLSENKPIRIFPSSTELSNGATDLTMIKEDSDEADDIIRKQYENMTYDEMSQRLAENYKQLSDILETRDITPSSTSSDKTNSMEGDRPQLLQEGEGDDDSLDEQQIVDNNDLDEYTKKRKLTKLFWRAASSGDSDKVHTLLQNDTTKALVDIDAKDEDGTTPLIYAACFGKVDIARILLSSGAKIDIQDSLCGCRGEG